jgi:prepilin-type processing-associated H-X9-DG protein
MEQNCSNQVLKSGMRLFLFGMVLLFSSCKQGAKKRRTNCSGNLKQIGLACLMYAGDYSGDYPPDLAMLEKEYILKAGKVYSCPKSAKGLRTISSSELQAGRVDYDYFGAGLRDDHKDAQRVVLAADKQGNHSDQWMNFLFADGHVEGCKARDIDDAAKKNGWIIPTKKK